MRVAPRLVATTMLCLVTSSADRSTWASPLDGSWSGASANATFLNQWQTQQGATAAASIAGSGMVTYLAPPQPGMPGGWQDPVSGNLSASAGSSSGQLLQVSATNFQVYAPGGGWPTSGPANASATATWTNDAVMVNAPAGSSLPSTVRLDFAVTVAARAQSGLGPNSYASVTAGINGTTLGYWINNNQDPNQMLVSDIHNNTFVDSSTAKPTNSANVITQTLHLDLPVASTGLSDPFSLSLGVFPLIANPQLADFSYSGITANIALTGVTLPNGTSLAALGDSVSFASGLPLPGPTPVPEPSTLAAWALAVAGVISLRVRRYGLKASRISRSVNSTTPVHASAAP